MPSSWVDLRPTWADVLPAVAASALVIASLFFDDPSVVYRFAPLDGWQIALAFVASAVLVLRRRHPATMFVVMLAGALALGLMTARTGLLPAVVAFGLAWVAFRGTVAQALASLAATAATFALLGRAGAPYFDGPAMWLTVGAFAVCWGLGLAARSWRDAQRRSVEEAERARLREVDAAVRAAEQERLALARDLHDSVASSIAAVVVQLDRLASESEPDVHRALSALSAEGRAAMGELRHMMELLRSGASVSTLENGTEVVPLGALARELVASAARLGDRVELHLEPPDLEVPSPQGVAALAVIGELLANARRHGDGAVVTLSVQRRAEDVELVCTNGVTASPNGAAGPTEGSGLGLRGVEERAARFGGTVSVDRTTARFRVLVTLPVEHR